MSDHDVRHEHQLEELLATAADPRTDFADSELADCPVCREDLEALLGLESHIVALGDAERAELTAALADVDTLESGPAEVAFRERLRGDPASGPTSAESAAARGARGTWRRIGPLLAAGLLVALVWWAGSDDPTWSDVPDVSMGADVQLIHPVDAVSAYAPFRWRASLPPDARFVVRVSDPTTDAELGRSEPLIEPRWDPPADSTDWPDEIAWTLEIQQHGEVARPLSARAQRLP